MDDPALAAALRRDRWIVVSALVVISGIALGYTFWLATGFDMSDMMSPQFRPWSAGYFGFMFAMWVIMMIGMMTPSVAPMVLLYAAIGRQNAARQPFAPAGWFLSGYLLAWSAFAAAATLLQWLLEWAAVVTPMMAGTSRLLGGLLLIAAGIYQWLPVKQACLASCRAPLAFVQRHGGFQPGARGALRLGALHGFYCIGCCWVLMALLFAFGVMNLQWIAALMVLVLIEKLAPAAHAVSRGLGIAAVVAGIALATTATSSQAAFCSRPSAAIASCTFGRAATRSWNALSAGQRPRSMPTKLLQFATTNR
jgi:predicted metal-binding membrane protein